MVELPHSEAELDALIEAALRDEPLLPVPVNLHGRITERVQLAALQQREQLRVRNALLSGFAASVAVVAAAGIIVAQTNFEVFLNHGVSGGRGLIDYYTATVSLSWPRYVENIGAAALLVAAAGVIWLAASSRWSGTGPLERGAALGKSGGGTTLPTS